MNYSILFCFGNERSEFPKQLKQLYSVSGMSEANSRNSFILFCFGNERSEFPKQLYL
jgi:hypothetical protein